MDGPGTLRIHPDGKQIAFAGRQQMRELWIMENFLPEPSASK
jgi:hypothetical protein